MSVFNKMLWFLFPSHKTVPKKDRDRERILYNRMFKACQDMSSDDDKKRRLGFKRYQRTVPLWREIRKKNRR